MVRMHIAYCIQGEQFKNDRLRDPRVSYLYPGSGWITVLYQIAAQHGIEVASGDIALENISNGKWSAKDVWVVQDMTSLHASQLLLAGASPFLITCFEAPLYAPFFYDKAEDIAAGFRFRYGFGLGDVSLTQEPTGRLLKPKFPSFYLKDMADIDQPGNWSGKKKLTLIAGNKFKSSKLFFPKGAGPVDLLRQMKWMGWRAISPSYAKSLRVCLHEARLDAIDYFARHGGVHLYGAGWDDMRGLPRPWAERLVTNQGVFNHGRCNNKLAILKEYRFSLCYENIAMPGYITEKIIDCFVAGVVPIYRGAPDIRDYISPDAFIAAEGDDLQVINQRMDSMDEEQARFMLACGRQYLQSEQGALHSYEGFAEAFMELVLAC